MSPNKLTDTQLVLLSAAAQRDDGAIDPAEGPKGGLAKKAISKLLTDGLVEEVPAGGMLPVWRRDDDRGPLALCITPRGLAAIEVEKTGALPEAPPLSGRTARMVNQLPMLHPKGRVPFTRQPRTDARPPPQAEQRRDRQQSAKPSRVFPSNPGRSKCFSGDGQHHPRDHQSNGLAAASVRGSSPAWCEEARPHARLEKTGSERVYRSSSRIQGEEQGPP